jgi:hypothetical protein
MRFELVQQNGSLRTFALDFATGDEVVVLVKQFVATQKIFAAEITALGGLSAVTLLCFDWDKQDYAPTSIQGRSRSPRSLGRSASRPPAVTLLSICMPWSPRPTRPLMRVISARLPSVRSCR